MPAPPRKKRRVFLWVFLAVQALFLVWLVTGLASSGDTGNCGSLSQSDCEAAAAVGTGIGVMLIVGVWAVVDFFLALIYGVYRLAKH